MEARFRSPSQVVFEFEQHVEEANEILFRKPLGLSGNRSAVVRAPQDLVLDAELGQKQVPNPGQELADELLQIQPLIDDHFDDLDQGDRVPLDQRVHRAVQQLGRDGPEDIANVAVGDLLSPESNDLIQQGLGIPHAAFSRPDDVVQGAVPDRDAFAFGDHAEMFLYFLRGNRPEDELLTPRKDRRRQLVALGRGHDERDVVGGFFKNLQQGVEGGRREHVHFVDDEYLEAVPGRRVTGVLAKLPDAVHAGVRRGVDFEDVDRRSTGDLVARGTFVARRRGGPFRAVQRLCQQPRRGGLSHTPGSTEQVGMPGPVHLDRVLQRLDDGFLPDDLFEDLWPKLARDDLIFHRRRWMRIAGCRVEMCFIASFRENAATFPSGGGRAASWQQPVRRQYGKAIGRQPIGSSSDRRSGKHPTTPFRSLQGQARGGYCVTSGNPLPLLPSGPGGVHGHRLHSPPGA